MRILTYACLILFGCAGPPADSENEAAAPITSEVVPQEASAPVLWVRVVEETSFFDDQVLAVHALPLFDVAELDLSVMVTSEGELAECKYTSSGPIWGDDDRYVELTGDLSCLMGAQFPVRRVARVQAEVGGGLMFGGGNELACEIDEAVSATQPRGTRTWVCAWSR